MAWVDASTVRELRNRGDVDAVYVVVGAADGYVGRDGKLPEGERRGSPVGRSRSSRLALARPRPPSGGRAAE